MLLNGGPAFSPNPAISFFVFINDRSQIDRLWTALIKDGKARMELGSYPWCEHYGWVEDRFGVSWQLMMADTGELEQVVVPALMFTQGAAGKAEEAVARYGDVLGGYRPVAVNHYPPGTGANEGLVMRLSNAVPFTPTSMFSVVSSSNWKRPVAAELELSEKPPGL